MKVWLEGNQRNGAVNSLLYLWHLNFLLGFVPVHQIVSDTPEAIDRINGRLNSTQFRLGERKRQDDIQQIVERHLITEALEPPGSPLDANCFKMSREPQKRHDKAKPC